MIRVRSQQDLAAGLFLIGVAVLAHTFASDLAMGRLVRMGPGYLPTVLSYLLGFLGLIIAVRGLTVDGPKLERWAWRPLIALTCALVLFALLLQSAGLVAAIVVTTFAAGFAAPGLRPIPSLALAVILSVLSVVLFVWLLGLPLLVWPDLG